MTSIKISFAVMALTQATHTHVHHKHRMEQTASPDVYGPNGQDYKNTEASIESSDIGINVTTKGTGPKCTPGDWATVHWKASLTDGRVVSDSRSEPGGQPKIFTLGDHQVAACWDIAIRQLNQGDHATLNCPSRYAWGNAYTQAPLGGEPIPLNSDVNFDIEIEECNRVPEFSWPEHKSGSNGFKPGKCMFLHLEESANKGGDLVLSAET